MTTFETAHAAVQTLIADFQANITHYLSPAYSEADVRKDFIDKFFTALGWDVNHDYQKNPYQQEVKIEKAQRQQGAQAQKRADYAFHLAPDYRTVQFFVEAKKPSRTLRQNSEDYFQTAKYGWNAQTGISVLTDFEEFVIIDCRAKPDLQTALNTELKYYKYTELQDPAIFSEIYWLFSHEAVAAGNLCQYLEDLERNRSKSKKGKQGSLFGGGASIDDSFLEYIDQIRLQMAQAFYSGNTALTPQQLTEATQRTIDRLVFMRFLEDKQIEPENILHNIAHAAHPWQKFIAESKRLDAKYNGIVFKPHFIDQAGFQGADQALFGDIAADLDHTNTPYDFNYIPIHILGNIYERFLGKIINIENGRAGIEAKLEVRKAGGVYYTPKYIVDYIVRHTIGSKITGKKPEDVAQMHFADIACGSGSFLIGAYDYLLEWHKSYYNHPTKTRTAEAKSAGCLYNQEHGVWVLSIRQKQQILLNNIFGVDIDPQAVEVSQVSLFLKLLEDESMTTANEMQVLFHEKILPDLSGNIQCGNSLVGYEIENGELDLGEDSYRKINPFDFPSSFPRIFGQPESGFDALIGNPPYVKEYTDKSVFEYPKKGRLAQYYQGKMDLWYFFACEGLDLLANGGKLGYIVPNNWVSNAGASILRNKIITDSKIEALIDFSDFMVFTDASIQTMIMLLEKNHDTDGYTFLHQTLSGEPQAAAVSGALSGSLKNVFDEIQPKIKRAEWKDKFLKFENDETETLLVKLQANAVYLNKDEVAQGIVFPQDFLNKKNRDTLKLGQVGDGIFALSEAEKQALNPTQQEFALIKPYYTSEQISRYLVLPKNTLWLIYTGSAFKDSSSMNAYPNLKRHLDKFADIITSDNKPYGLHRAREQHFFQGEKIICQRKCVERPVFAYADFDTYVSATYYVIQTQRFHLKYLLCLLNSKVVQFWLRHKGKMQGSNFQVDKEPLLQIPIVKTSDKKRHDELVNFADQMSKAQQNARAAVTDSDKSQTARRIAYLENQINQTVYQLYGLNADEIALIEQRTA